jgi:hypothetical protein
MTAHPTYRPDALMAPPVPLLDRVERLEVETLKIDDPQLRRRPDGAP